VHSQQPFSFLYLNLTGLLAVGLEFDGENLWILTKSRRISLESAVEGVANILPLKSSQEITAPELSDKRVRKPSRACIQQLCLNVIYESGRGFRRTMTADVAWRTG
jgi:hypothetical protein